MPTLPGGLLKRGVTETIANALANSGSGSQQYATPTEGIGARLAWQVIITGAPTAVSIPLLGSLDGVNFDQIDVSTATAGELRVLADLAVAFIKVGTITLTGGTSPSATVLARAQ